MIYFGAPVTRNLPPGRVQSNVPAGGDIQMAAFGEECIDPSFPLPRETEVSRVPPLTMAHGSRRRFPGR